MTTIAMTRRQRGEQPEHESAGQTQPEPGNGSQSRTLASGWRNVVRHRSSAHLSSAVRVLLGRDERPSIMLAWERHRRGSSRLGRCPTPTLSSTCDRAPTPKSSFVSWQACASRGRRSVGSTSSPGSAPSSGEPSHPAAVQSGSRASTRRWSVRPAIRSRQRSTTSSCGWPGRPTTSSSTCRMASDRHSDRTPRSRTRSSAGRTTATST